ncbi:hypothetical protein D3C72_1398950 [compost metagenome]
MAERIGPPLPSCSVRSEKNTSCRTLSRARSSRIITIIASIALSFTIGSHFSSGMARSLMPYSSASAWPTGTR